MTDLNRCAHYAATSFEQVCGKQATRWFNVTLQRGVGHPVGYCVKHALNADHFTEMTREEAEVAEIHEQ
jgi:hypothetical protein